MKLLIIGAGATRGSEHANQDRLPPISNKELLRMFEDKYGYHIPTIDESYNRFFSNALKLYENDIEAMFTGIYILANPALTLKDEKTRELEKLAYQINDIDSKKFLSMLTIFQGRLYMELQLCIGTKGKFPIPPAEMPICSWHRKIAKELDYEDVVVNFNYDLIMPYALLNEKKLSKKSFLNPYIKEVGIPENLLSHNPVILISPHGSFSWLTRKKLNYWDKTKFNPSETFFSIMSENKNIDRAKMSPFELADFNFKLDPPHIRVNLNNNSSVDYDLSKVILPLQKKKQIFDDVEMRHFKEEYNLFLNKLKQADKIYLIGKNFIKSDKDISDDIQAICSKSEKHVIYINPDTKDSQWISSHNKIFNAASHDIYENLPDYINKKGLC